MGRYKESKFPVGLRKSTEQRQNRCVKGSQNGLYAKKEPSKGLTLPDSRMVSMGVLSDDFATVDLREDYANLSLPKEAKFKR